MAVENGSVTWDSPTYQQGGKAKESPSISLGLFAPGLLLNSTTCFGEWTGFSPQLTPYRRDHTDLRKGIAHSSTDPIRWQARSTNTVCLSMYMELEYPEGKRIVLDSSHWADIRNTKCTYHPISENYMRESWVPEMNILISSRASTAKTRTNTNGRAVLSSQKGQGIGLLFIFPFISEKKCVFSVIAVSILGFLSLASDLLGTLKGEHLCVCFAPFC